MAKSLRKDFEIAPGAWIGNTRPVFVIAEIGQNHQGKCQNLSHFPHLKNAFLSLVSKIEPVELKTFSRLLNTNIV